jgi:hypothetical protein
MHGGSGTQTVAFSSASDAASFSGSFGSGVISLGSGDDNVTFSNAGVTGTTIVGTGDADTINFVSGNTSVVFGSAIGSASEISFGTGADMATFNGSITAASIFGGAGADTFNFDNAVVNGTSFQGGLGDDAFTGSISVGSSGVSFWSGAGADSFSLGYVSNAAGTAYFWNEAGQDTIVFDASAATNTSNFAFGSSISAQSFFTLNANYTTMFSNVGISSSFLLGESDTLATAQFGTTMITLNFANGTSIIFGGNAAFTGAFDSAFGSVVSAGGGLDVDNTIAFGTTTTIPSFL